MGKRSSFDRVEKDFYPTPRAAVLPLLPHLGPMRFRFAEPCAGDGRLVRHLEAEGHRCVLKSDIDPRANGIKRLDALAADLRAAAAGEIDLIITNPPWTRDVLHPLIKRFSDIAPSWLLFDADWAHTEQASGLLKRCRRIVSVGRVKWIEDSKSAGVDNACWYLFDAGFRGQPEFYGRGA